MEGGIGTTGLAAGCVCTSHGRFVDRGMIFTRPVVLVDSMPPAVTGRAAAIESDPRANAAAAAPAASNAAKSLGSSIASP